ncbi:hypothetical protein [Arenibaculum pallidiluteum]|uniref:hypothetical protein n=1 Tax=Arenibaculum pallidiluteum TaxID=2812559 RepID=UPI001A97646C|nr:hypothetical protein [Arenibaculum pallidiluteum]
MKHVAPISRETFAAIRAELRGATVTPGTTFLLVSGVHPRLGETMLVQDGQQAHVVSDTEFTAVATPAAGRAAAKSQPRIRRSLRAA